MMKAGLPCPMLRDGEARVSSGCFSRQKKPMQTYQAVAGGHRCHADGMADSKTHHNPTPLSYAAEMGCEGVVVFLLATGKVVVNAKDPTSGDTPLTLAAKKNHINIVKRLLTTDMVDANAKSKAGRTPLEYAEEKRAQRYRSAAARSS
ncbi:hypothetical protein B0H63DRAFT_445016 [Podospora didyma]|uniref:Ankyrin repeat domain-containing protein n=1 Tax=Podospora didyma TaxID=330526 RepID=A0AAE0U8Z7_9PEZI|nr:hypothetical protein B0H63DRAFT_445016 [Podospora didyma]